MIGFLIWDISAIVAIIIWAVHANDNLNSDLVAILFICICPIYNTFYVITRFPRFCKELKNSKFFEKLKNM